MTTALDKILRREVKIGGRAFVVALSPEGLKLTLKGKRKGQELRWSDLISGDAALATALNASLGQFTASSVAAPREPTKPAAPHPAAPRRRAPAVTAPSLASKKAATKKLTARPHKPR